MSVMKDLINESGIVMNHQPDGSVIMNDDLVLTEDMPRDSDGFTRAENDRVIVSFNFETRTSGVTIKKRILWGRVYATVFLLAALILAIVIGTYAL